jgi:TetR/AcrR family transcriptional repressor of mexJK operon
MPGTAEKTKRNPKPKTKDGRTRGRPSRQEAEVIDRNVLEAAKQNFLSNGFANTTMDAIAKQAGVTKATLYQRYDDKASLLRAVMRERLEAWTETSNSRAVTRRYTVRAHLLHYGRSMARWWQEPEIKAFSELLRECWGIARPVAEEMQKMQRTRMLDVMERDISKYAPKSGANPSNPRLIAEMFLGLIGAVHSHVEEAGCTNDTALIDAYVEQAVGIILDGKSSW